MNKITNMPYRFRALLILAHLGEAVVILFTLGQYTAPFVLTVARNCARWRHAQLTELQS
jgi:hypothetical protein